MTDRQMIMLYLRGRSCAQYVRMHANIRIEHSVT